MYYTYMLRCKDGSLYTGIAADVKKRMGEHFGKTNRCAKYTRSHTAEELSAVWQSEEKALACRLEYRIKRLTRQQKLQLIIDNDMSVFGDSVDTDKYERIYDLGQFGE